jgi:carboxymethylenebutenolidase
MKKVSWLTFVALFASLCFAAAGKSVSYKSADETVQAALYTPSGKTFPALIVVHEYWGLNDWVKEQASQLGGSRL